MTPPFPRSTFAALVFVLALIDGIASPAHAHVLGLSQGTWAKAGDVVTAELVFQRDELITRTGFDRDADGALSTAELEAAIAALSVRAGAALCTGSVEGHGLVEEDGFALRARFACPSDVAVSLDLGPWLARFSAGHRHLARVHSDAATDADDRVLDASSAPTFFDVDAPGQTWAYVWIGVEHILLGFDHLVFLLGLVLVRMRLRGLLATITAFTVAHSLTLALAVLDVIEPSPALIEPLIALSIAFIGIENLLRDDGLLFRRVFGRGANVGEESAAEGRWRAAALFGLIHGFGFAGALGEVGLPADAVPLTLFLFNVGVELGQLGVLALVWPLLVLLRRRADDARVVAAVGSLAIVALGLFWLVERVAF